ncbi:hypothetical protein I5J74_29575 [Pseudomonas aeruginosa]|nr:hypothetical protein [Pseudomonas aeruginosa]
MRGANLQAVLVHRDALVEQPSGGLQAPAGEAGLQHTAASAQGFGEVAAGIAQALQQVDVAVLRSFGQGQLTQPWLGGQAAVGEGRPPVEDALAQQDFQAALQRLAGLPGGLQGVQRFQ